MGNISLELVGEFVGFIVALVGGLGYLNRTLKKWIGSMMDEQLQKINARMDSVDLESCKNFLVRCLADVERGQPMSETEDERFWEQYGYYSEHGGNSYIKTKIERLQKEGKL